MKKISIRYLNHALDYLDGSSYYEKMKKLMNESELADTLIEHLTVKKQLDQMLDSLRENRDIERVDQAAFSREKDRSIQIKEIKEIINK